MDELAQKDAFAAHFLRLQGAPNAAFEAASIVFPAREETGIALQVAQLWPKDPYVKAVQERLLSTPQGKTYLPTKEVQAKDIYAMASDQNQLVEDRLKAHKLYAELMGFIERPMPGNQTNILNQGVMIVRDQGSNDEWEAKAQRQQRELTSNVIN